MKRLGLVCLASLALQGGAIAQTGDRHASSKLLHSANVQLDSRQGEIDLPPAPPAPPARSASLYGASAVYGANERFSSAVEAPCGCDEGFSGCFEREYSPLDGVWAGYCAQKPHRHCASILFGMMHVNASCGPHCCPPAACQVRPALPPLGCRLECGSDCDAPYNCHQRHRGLHLPAWLSRSKHCSSYAPEAAGCSDCASDIEEHSPEMIESAPALAPPMLEKTAPMPEEPLPPQAEEISPSDEVAPQEPPPSANRNPNGWLGFPRLRLLPL